MKKFFITILAALCVIAGLAGVIGCDSGSGKTYSIAVSCGEGGTYTLSHDSPVQENCEVTLTAVPEYGYAADSLTINGQAAEFTDNEYTFTVQSDVTAEITFKKLPMCDLTVTCGENGDYSIEHEGKVVVGSDIILTPLPDNGYEVDKVYLNGYKVDPVGGKYILKVTEDSAVDITFKAHIHSYGNWEITAPTLTGGGTAVRTCPNCSEQADGHSETVALPPLTDKGYSVDEVVPSTCESAGKGDYSIEINGVTFTFAGEIAKKAHSYQFTIREYPTKNYGGVAAGTCTQCGEGASGHTITVDLPTDDGTAYTVTGNTATCTVGGRANYSVTVNGYEISFSMETDPLGHDFSNGTGKCSRCSEAEGVFDSRFIGTWKTDGLPERTLIIGGNSVSLNGAASLSVSEGERTDGGEQTFTFTIGETNYTIVAYEGRYNNITRYYVLEVSYLHPETNLRLASQYFKSDYPIPAFPEEVEGRWAAGDNIISITGKTLRFNEELAVIKSYVPSANGFTLTFNDASEEDVLSAHAADKEDFTLKYTKNNDTLVLINNADNSQTVCEIDTSLDKVLIPEGCDGTYVSDDGEYTIVVDKEGRLSFNGVRYALDNIGYYQYSFVVDNIAYRISIYYNQTAMTLNCAALAIENVKLTKLT